MLYEELALALLLVNEDLPPLALGEGKGEGVGFQLALAGTDPRAARFDETA